MSLLREESGRISRPYIAKAEKKGDLAGIFMNIKEEHRATQRVIDILTAVFEAGEAGQSLSMLAQTLGAPKSSLFPIVHTLHAGGLLLYRAQTGTYTMGYMTYKLGTAYTKKNAVNASILEIMREITKQCRETCFFGELTGGDVRYIFKVDSPEPLRMVDVGHTLPAYSSGIGKALLSECTRKELGEIYREPLRPLTGHTITDLNILYEQLLEAKKRGIAFEKEESTQFIQCIAIPIYRASDVRAALSVAVPTFRYSSEKEALIIGLLKQAQIRIEEILDAGEWSGF